ncbi:MAG: hypothetical protein IJS00_07150 [Paludibacteraceae bacterium]|nr:hypothetical protein [Paludibacteraceae bacterium]
MNVIEKIGTNTKERKQIKTGERKQIKTGERKTDKSGQLCKDCNAKRGALPRHSTKTIKKQL